MNKEWYILEYERKKYLHNKSFILKKYQGEHDHCGLCWDKFSEHIEDLHTGYYEPELDIWICNDCFEKYGQLFGWTEITNMQEK